VAVGMKILTSLTKQSNCPFMATFMLPKRLAPNGWEARPEVPAPFPLIGDALTRHRKRSAPWERGRLARSSARMAAAPGCGQDARAPRGE
jgi:hypothetical protein